MFFSQFLCLFYLMALANAYTISKTTSTKEDSDSIHDNINDVESSQRSHKYAKLHNYRKLEPGPRSRFITTTETRRPKPHKTMKRRSGGFWRKNKNKHKSTIPLNDYESLNLEHDNVLDGNGIKNTGLRMKRNKFNEKLNSDQDEITNEANSSYKRGVNKTDTDLKLYQKYINDVVRKLTEQQRVFTPDYKNNIKKLPTTTASRVTDLSSLESEIIKFNPKSIKVQMLDTTPLVKSEQSEMATAQIEALLNEIKERAVQMVSEINPNLSDLITNTVTETTFEMDPLLKKIALTTPDFAFSTFVSVNNVFNKRTINDTELAQNDIELNTQSPHKIDSRSLKEDGMTIAQTIEDYLQKELKNLCKKFKDTVGKDLQKEVKHAKTTIKKGSNEITKKISSETKPIIKSKTSTKKKPVARSNRDKSKKPTTIRTSSTVDDYILLTLYEQILTKTHEDNVMKMVTMPSFHYVNKRSEPLISKRNLKTLADAKLKDDLKKVFDDGVMVPDTYDFSSDINVDVSSPSNDYSEDVRDQGTTEKIATDTSYEGLTNKLSYNDYVNGYKYYLKFQKDEANTNFSNLVKYQAHKHHNVDDIGKFILNKIPQINPSKREKREKNEIFDDNDFDDQEVSTKTDDSWFKKHFYMFVDNGPPKKFHTSQTVALKAPIGDIGTKKDFPTTNKEVEERDVNSNNRNQEDKSDGSEVNLEELTKDLEDKLSSMDKDNGKATAENKIESTANTKDSESALQNLPIIKEIQYSIEKMFGKGRRTISTTEKGNRKSDYYEDNDELNDFEEMEDGFDMSMINNFDSADEKEFIVNRIKRNPIKHVHDKITDLKKSTSSVVGKNDALKSKKYGCVNIDILPTQIVTLRDKKESRLKKILNAFHRNKNKVHKRENPRIQRFNPLKKIKDMFLSKSDDKSNNKALSGLDYELLTTKLTGFKPYKFDRVQTLEDMQRQIPNITDDTKDKSKINDIVNEYDTEKTMSDVSEASKDNFMVFTDYNLNDNFMDIIETQLQANMKTDVDITEFSTPTSSTTFPTFTTKRKSTSFPVINYKFRDSTYNDNLLTVNILENITTPEFETTSMPRVSPDDINKELDKLQVKVTLNSNYYDRPIQKLSVTTPKMTKKIVNNKQTSANRGIIIGAKETRIAKFHFKPKEKSDTLDNVPILESPHFYEGVYEVSGGSKQNDVKNKITDDKINFDVLPNEINFPKNSNMKKSILNDKALQRFVTILPTTTDPSLTTGINGEKSIKPYPDYFNDLIMWNHDILNYDRLPHWHNLINTDLVTVYSTPDVQDIRRELSDLEEVINDHATEKRVENNYYVTDLIEMPSVKNDFVHKQPKNSLIRRLALKDDAIGSSNEILIKGEAKYFRYDKQPVELAEEFIKTIDVINRVSNVDSKSDFNKKIARKDDQFNYIELKPPHNAALPVDSTLFSYDDDMDFVTATLESKKLSKNSLKRLQNMRNRTTVKPITTINMAPIQHFATPLPMRMNHFEKFLKENNLDVASVTSPLMELPSITSIITDKQEENKLKTHKDDSTTLPDNKFASAKKLHKVKEPKVNKAKVTKSDIAEDLEGLEELHKELFTDNETVRGKRDTNVEENNDVPEKYIDNIKLFELVDNDQVPKPDPKHAKESTNGTHNSLTIIKVEDVKDEGLNAVKDDAIAEIIKAAS